MLVVPASISGRKKRSPKEAGHEELDPSRQRILTQHSVSRPGANPLPSSYRPKFGKHFLPPTLGAMASRGPSGSPGKGGTQGAGQRGDAAPGRRSRSPRGSPAGETAQHQHTRGLPSPQMSGPVPGVRDPGTSLEPGGTAPAQDLSGSSQAAYRPAPRGPLPYGGGAASHHTATAAALASQLPLQQAAVAASQAARAAAATVPARPPGGAIVPTGTSLAILEAQVAALGSLLLALQGIVLQLIAVVNLMRSGH